MNAPHNPESLPRALQRRDFLRSTGLAALVGAGAVVGSDSAWGAARASRVPGLDCASTRNLGPGAVDFPVIGGALVGGSALAGSRNLTPAKLAVFDVGTSRVTHNVTIPTGTFVQAIAAASDEVAYVGVYFASNDVNLYRYEAGTDSVVGIASLPKMNVRALAVAPDGMVFATGAPSNVYAYDPTTGQVSLLPRPDPEAPETYGVAATESTVFVGSGSFVSGKSTPRLTAIDRATGQMQSILPPELADAQIIYSMRVSGDRLLFGTYGLEAAFVVMDLEDFSQYDVVSLPGQKIVDAVERVGDVAYFTTRYSGSLWRYDLATGEATETPGPQAGFPHWSITHLDGQLVGISVNSVWTRDLTTGQDEVHSLVNAGAEGQPQQMQSIAAGAGKVMVAANWNVGLRDLDTGELTSFNVPGEAKDMVFIDGVLYLAMYTVGEIWTYDPSSGTAARTAKMPPEQNRPAAITHDRVNDLVLVATSSDFTGGGALVAYDRRSGNVTTYENPFGPDQPLVAVAALGRTAVIADRAGDIAGIDPTTGNERWRLDRFVGDGVTGLTTYRGSIYGATAGGTLFGLRANGRIWTELSDQDLGGNARLFATPRGGLYGASTSKLFWVDPRTCEAHTVVDDLGSMTFNGADLYLDEEGRIYVLQGTDVLQVTVPRRC